MSLKEFKKNGTLLNGFHKVRSKKLKCSGTFKNGKLNGRGKCEFFRKIKKSDITNPSIMDGKWVDNELVKGKKVYPYYSKKTKKTQNQIHIGSFKNGKLNGKGEKIWRNASENGTFKNGKLDGKGKSIFDYYSKNTKKMEENIDSGTFKNGKLDGKCVKKWRNAIYRGMCKNGRRHGQGTFIFEGKKSTGTFKNDKLINEPQNWLHKISSYLQNLTR